MVQWLNTAKGCRMYISDSGNLCGEREGKPGVYYCTTKGYPAGLAKVQAKMDSACKITPPDEEERKPAFIEFSTDVPVDVDIDGKVLAKVLASPVKIEVAPGAHVLSLRAPGYWVKKYTHTWVPGESFPAESFAMRVKEKKPPPAPPKREEGEHYAFEGDWYFPIEMTLEEAKRKGMAFKDMELKEIQEHYGGAQYVTFDDLMVFLPFGLTAALPTKVVTKLGAEKAGAIVARGFSEKAVVAVSRALKMPVEEVIRTHGAILRAASKAGLSTRGAVEAVKAAERLAATKLAEGVTKSWAGALWKGIKYLGGGTLVGLFLMKALWDVGFTAPWIPEEGVAGISIGTRDLLNDAKFETDPTKKNELLDQIEKNIQVEKQTIDLGIKNTKDFGKFNPFTYEAWKQYYNTQLAAVESQELRVKNLRSELTPEEEKTTITFKGSPQAVEISVGGVGYSAMTPFTVEVEEGKAEYVIRADGYEQDRGHEFLDVGDKKTVAYELEELPAEPELGEKIKREVAKGGGRLQVLIYDDITGKPLAATMLLNGRVEPFTLHSYVVDLKPGSHELRFEKAGYDFYDDTVAVDEGKLTAITVRMKKSPALELEIPPELPEEIVPEVPATGKLEIVSKPAAEVFIAGKKVAESTPVVLDLVQGFYDVTLKADGFYTLTRSGIVRTGELSRLSLSLVSVDEPPPARLLAKVSFNSSPTGAKILINDNFTRKYTPDFLLMEEGEYKVTYTKSGFEPWIAPLRLVRE